MAVTKQKRTKAINALFSENEFNEITQYCQAEGISRANLVRKLLFLHLSSVKTQKFKE